MRFNHWPMPDLPVSFRKTKLWGLQDGCRGEGREGEREGLECSSRYRGHVDFRGCLCPAARKIRKIDAKKTQNTILNGRMSMESTDAVCSTDFCRRFWDTMQPYREKKKRRLFLPEFRENISVHQYNHHSRKVWESVNAATGNGKNGASTITQRLLCY